ncbi:MAG: glycyl-radical enzyme activating protein [Candidatus Bathyarchaeia archaeon]
MVLVIKGLVFDIKRFAVHDGPGIRTTVFLKGCPLRCFWCQNPEGIKLKQEIMFYLEKCVGCGACVATCPKSAHEIRNNVHVYFRDRCEGCGRCVEGCCSGALQLVGRWMDVDDLIKVVLMDKPFYEVSNGGVTLSGGDPMVQHEFSYTFLERCKSEGLHTAIETAAYCKWEILEKLLSVTDLVMMDIKHIDPEVHRKVTGVRNDIILENARRLAETDKPLIIRIPIIPTINDSPEEVAAIAKFIQPFKNLLFLELLPFHRLGEVKYRALGINYPASNLKIPSKTKMQELVEAAKKFVPNVFSA